MLWFSRPNLMGGILPAFKQEVSVFTEDLGCASIHKLDWGVPRHKSHHSQAVGLRPPVAAAGSKESSSSQAHIMMQ